MNYIDLISVPNPTNTAVSPARQITMISLLGNPRDNYSQQCRGINNSRLKSLIKTDSIGPFRVTGLSPAVDSLKEVFLDIKLEYPELHDLLSTAGMLCARYVRGSKTSISNHSWGTAIDLKIKGELDARGNDRVQYGLTLIAPIFNKHGWYWGAGFRTEDAMHFEVSDQKIRKWHQDGILGITDREISEPVISRGDRGEDVKKLQAKLNSLGRKLKVDGVFGTITMSAIMDFQAQNGLKVDGIVGRNTWKRLNELTSVVVA